MANPKYSYDIFSWEGHGSRPKKPKPLKRMETTDPEIDSYFDRTLWQLAEPSTYHSQFWHRLVDPQKTVPTHVTGGVGETLALISCRALFEATSDYAIFPVPVSKTADFLINVKHEGKRKSAILEVKSTQKYDVWYPGVKKAFDQIHETLPLLPFCQLGVVAYVCFQRHKIYLITEELKGSGGTSWLPALVLAHNAFWVGDYGSAFELYEDVLSKARLGLGTDLNLLYLLAWCEAFLGKKTEYTPTFEYLASLQKHSDESISAYKETAQVIEDRFQQALPGEGYEAKSLKVLTPEKHGSFRYSLDATYNMMIGRAYCGGQLSLRKANRILTENESFVQLYRRSSSSSAWTKEGGSFQFHVWKEGRVLGRSHKSEEHLRENMEEVLPLLSDCTV